MKDDEKRSNKISIAIVGFVAGVLTVLLVLFAMKGLLKSEPLGLR